MNLLMSFSIPKFAESRATACGEIRNRDTSVNYSASG